MKKWLLNYGQAWAALLEGLINVLSFGLCWPNLDMKYIFWKADVQFRDYKKVKNESHQ